MFSTQISSVVKILSRKERQFNFTDILSTFKQGLTKFLDHEMENTTHTHTYIYTHTRRMNRALGRKLSNQKFVLLLSLYTSNERDYEYTRTQTCSRIHTCIYSHLESHVHQDTILLFLFQLTPISTLVNDQL